MYHMMNLKIRASIATGLLAVVGTATAATNLVTNGNFATGDFTGWVVGGNNTGYPPAVVTTGTACCFDETVPVDPLTVGSPDPGGTHAVYFVDDDANQTLTQSIHLAAGEYQIGFDAYATYNGFSNPGDADFTAMIAGVKLASYSVHTQDDPGVWINFSGVADVLTAGTYSVAFDFQTFGGPSADVLIDRVFVDTTTKTGGTPIGVPEPATLALVGLGLASLGFVRRRKAS
jgi:PEP-CTERM motif